jgi:integrase
LDRLGIDRLTRVSGFHAFRHAVASVINDRTGDIKLAQKLLGHTNVSMAANVYTHTYSDSERRATGELERAIFGDSLSFVPQSVPHAEQEQGANTRS